MVVMLRSASRPSYAVLGRLPHSQVFCDLGTPGAARVPGVAIFAFDAPLHFDNLRDDRLRDPRIFFEKAGQLLIDDPFNNPPHFTCA